MSTSSRLSAEEALDADEEAWVGKLALDDYSIMKNCIDKLFSEAILSEADYDSLLSEG